MSGTTVQTALCVVVKDDRLNKSLNNIREHCDKAHPRWMPHINLIYPFVPQSQFDSVAMKLQGLLGSTSPFTASLDSLSYFSQRGAATVHFQPSGNFDVLYDKAVKALPLTARGGLRDHFEPHLTMGQAPLPPKDTPPPISGQCSSSQLISYIKQQMRGVSTSFRVEELVMIARDGDVPFTVRKRIPIGKPVLMKPTQRIPRPIVSHQESNRLAINAVFIPAAAQAAQHWIAKMPTKKLPKTPEGLMAAIKPFCSVRVQLDAELVLKKLLSTGKVRRSNMQIIDRDEIKDRAAPATGRGRGGAAGRGRGAARPPPRPVGPPPTKTVSAIQIMDHPTKMAHPNSSACFGDEELWAKRLTFFLNNLAGSQKKQRRPEGNGRFLMVENDNFMKQLQQICQVTAVVSQEEVAKHLLASRAVQVSDEGALQYSKP